jgi:hypothetical protein
MRRAVPIGSSILALSLFAAAEAGAEPFVVTPTTVSTSGVFSCRANIACSGEGTDTITIGSGENTAMISFTGVQLSFDVTNELTHVTMGSFEMTASDRFTFPVRTNNPTGLPVLNFVLTTHQSDPVSTTSFRLWEFGPGGHGTIPVMVGNGYQVLGLGGTAGGYHSTVYTYRPFPITLSPGTVSLTADAGAVPEPATMFLLGTGLIGVASAAKRRKRTVSQK